MNIALILSLLAAGSTLIAAKYPTDENGKPCRCNRMHDPVCGSDGQDYPNRDCARTCRKLKSFVGGTCARPALCGCPYNIATVCARRPDGTLDNFDNRCHAQCQNGAEFVSDGPCPARPVQPLPDLFVEQLRELRSVGEERVKKQCICTAIYDPVCGLKNRIWREYASQCVADCAGVETTRPGTCRSKRSCPCGRNFRPVCALKQDGTLQDYANDCLAECENAAIVSSGRCLAKPDNSLPRQARTTEEQACNNACTLEFKPVCTQSHNSKKLYTNRCFALCDKATNIQEGSCESAAQLPVFPDDTHAAQLPVFPDDTHAAQLPVFPNNDEDNLSFEESNDSDDLDAAQLPWIPDDSDDRYATQLPWIPHASDGDEDSETGEGFPLLKLLKRMAQR